MVTERDVWLVVEDSRELCSTGPFKRKVLSMWDRHADADDECCELTIKFYDCHPMADHVRYSVMVGPHPLRHFRGE